MTGMGGFGTVRFRVGMGLHRVFGSRPGLAESCLSALERT